MSDSGRVLGDCYRQPSGEAITPKPVTRSSGHPRFYELVQEIADLHEKKSKDYGRGEKDPLYNLKSSRHVGLEPVHGVLLRMNDKFSRIGAFVKNGNLANESMEDNLKDIAVYALLAIILLEEDKK